MTVEVGCNLGSGAGTIGIGPSFGDGIPTVSMTVGTVSLAATTTDYQPGKDVYWPDVALCPDDANKDGGNLQVDGVVATKQVACVGFDLSTYPTGTTVSAATLALTVATVPVGPVNGNDRCRLITTATEVWAEGAAKCSDHPADDGEAGAAFAVRSTLNGGVVGDVYTITLNAAARTRMQSRMGVGSFSLIIDSTDVTTVNHAFFDKENGTSAQRALLTFSWSKTL